MSKNGRFTQKVIDSAPASRDEADVLIQKFMQQVNLPPEGLREFDEAAVKAFAGSFTHRDEANALIALAVRNGPIEDLHAGKHSALLEDHTLSRLTNSEMKVLMIYATRILAALLAMRDTHPEAYRRHLQLYGAMYCREWERWPDE